ncbi:hypothetical protein ACLK1S_20260 [Escherichia coli]
MLGRTSGGGSSRGIRVVRGDAELARIHLHNPCGSESRIRMDLVYGVEMSGRSAHVEIQVLADVGQRSVSGGT